MGINIKPEIKLDISILSLRLSTGVGKLDHRKGKLDIKLAHHLGKVDSPPGKLDIKLDNPMGKLDNYVFQTRPPDGQTRQPYFQELSVFVNTNSNICRVVCLVCQWGCLV